MARNSAYLLNLDVDKLFEDHKIEEIVEIEKLLEAEIERKRVELRSMVGDRYKDVLAASDAIKNMKTISQEIVNNIQKITDSCQDLIENSSKDSKEVSKQSAVIEKENVEERMLVMQIRLAIFINEQIWIALDHGDNLTAAQFYLLAQHMHMGLSLSPKEQLDRLPLLKQISSNLSTLRNQIFSRIKAKLESVEINAEETSSNLNALLLLQNQSTSELFDIFISHRKTALHTVIKCSHPSVRVQVSAMVKCLITTIHLLHDCFTNYNDSGKGLLWQQLENIVEESSIPTISKVQLPVTPLAAYIPDIIKQFRPKRKVSLVDGSKETVNLDDWLPSTKASVKDGLDNSLQLVTNVKGLHIIREEALKIELPSQWEKLCSGTKLPEHFNVWYYFFQNLMTNRARELISKKVASIMKDIQSDVTGILSANPSLEQTEMSLRWSTWSEEFDDVSRTENKHVGLSMKTQGYSQNIVNLCEKLNSKYLELLEDVSQYLYGKELDECTNPNLISGSSKLKKKFIDKNELEHHLRIECTKNAALLTKFLKDFVKSENNPDMSVLKSLMCARFLQAVTDLCPHFNQCCSFSGTSEDWNKICSHFTKSSLEFWMNWIEKCIATTRKEAAKQLTDINISTMIAILPKWDVIEIQEQTEEKVFKSQIKVPLKPSLALHNILVKLNGDIDDILPHTLPKQIHIQYIEKNVDKILEQYKDLAGHDLNQNQALQFLFDVKFLTAFCIPRENSQLISLSQEICDKLRSKIDPFDLDVFYSHLQSNVKRAVMQSQVILGCLLPSAVQLTNLGPLEKAKEQEKEPSIVSLSIPSSNSWFPLLPISTPSQKTAAIPVQKETKGTSQKSPKTTPKRNQDPTAAMRSSAAALFGGLTTDWFS